MFVHVKRTIALHWSFKKFWQTSLLRKTFINPHDKTISHDTSWPEESERNQSSCRILYRLIEDKILKRPIYSFRSLYTCLPYEINVVCANINVVCANIIDTSIKGKFQSQSFHTVKGCMDIMFDMIDIAFNYWRALIVCLFLRESSKVKESSFYVIWNAHTAFYFVG